MQIQAVYDIVRVRPVIDKGELESGCVHIIDLRNSMWLPASMLDLWEFPTNEPSVHPDSAAYFVDLLQISDRTNLEGFESCVFRVICNLRHVSMKPPEATAMSCNASVH